MLDIYHNTKCSIKEQEDVIIKINNVLQEYINYKNHFFSKKPKLNWIYLYGGVGQGKTMIANLILESFQNIKSQIIHCLSLLSILQNNEQKLPTYNLIIIDEFEVLDIVASKLIRDYLAKNANKIVIFTSNKSPDNLYKNGLQRQMFLSAIEQIKNQALVIELNIGKDYRIDAKNFTFFNNINDARSNIYKDFLSHITYKVMPKKININGRYLSLETACKNLLYVDFDFLCNTPLGSEDYIEICKEFNHIFIGGFYNPDIENLDIIRRFIVFMDTAYLYKIKLTIGFDFDFKKLDKFLKIMPEVTRAISRLHDLY